MMAIFLVMANSEHLDAVLEAWREAGLGGVTVLESFGTDIFLKKHTAEDSLPIFGSVTGYLRSKRQQSYTLISIVEEEGLIDEAIRATESIMGDLTQRGRGILFVVAVEKVVGYRRGDK